MIRLIITAAVMAIATSSPAKELPPIMKTGRAEFGPEESQAKACDRALADAKQKVLREAFGEEIGQKSVLTCDQNIYQQTGNDCELFENTWSTINTNGFIKKIVEPEGRRITQETGFSVCLVTAYITLEEYDGQRDFAFETSISVSQGMNLRRSDKPIFEIESNQPAFHYVYYWAPFVKADQYEKLFPNPYDKQAEKVTHLRIPTGQATANYKIDVSLPDGMTYSHEYLILISSKQPLKSPPDKITEVNFFRWLNSFNREDWTQSTVNYRVLGDSAWQN